MITRTRLDRRGSVIRTHGYSGYSRGCRCPVCRQAKADYQAGRRAVAFLETSPVVEGITHGRFGYEERGCRCDVCVEARRTMWREDNARRHPNRAGEAA